MTYIPERQVTPEPQVIPEPQVKDWIRPFGINVPNGCAIGALDGEADATPGGRGAPRGALGELRPPLVLKAFGPGVVHKSELGAVRLGLAGALRTPCTRPRRPRTAGRP